MADQKTLLEKRDDGTWVAHDFTDRETLLMECSATIAIASLEPTLRAMQSVLMASVGSTPGSPAIDVEAVLEQVHQEARAGAAAALAGVLVTKRKDIERNGQGEMVAIVERLEVTT